MKSIDPATGRVLASFEEIGDEELESRLALSRRAFESWRSTGFDLRAVLMLRAAEFLESAKRDLGRLMTLEMGKPIGAAIAEAEKCAWVCRYYAENAASQLADEEVATQAKRSWIAFRPLGPVLAVMPWNFPFWQVFRFAAPALMAGNVGLLKHASNVPRCALAIEDVFRQAGFPEGVFQTLMVGSARVAAIITDPRIRAVTLTGSESAGRAVAAAAGANIRKTVLELGGSDPFIVMPSADLDAAVRTAVRARTLNNGQSCIAAKRFIVARPIADAFEERFVAGMSALNVGDPMDEATDVGPLATPAILNELDAQVRATVAAGARVLLGGSPLQRAGNFYPPTVITDIPRGSPAWGEELFGPVASVFRADDVEEAIRIANDTPFGLGAAAWTRDADEQERLIRGIEAGAVFINGMVASDPRLPFGGVKNSGYGRELATPGIREFVNIQTVWVGG
jgi:succinate-semialdehyde dehydrogenase/glutarate-semialdehyde dehydrogenase